MTLHGIGDVTTQDIGAALSQAGTILNPGTYTNTWNGGVLYTPATAVAPGPMSAASLQGSISPTTLLLIGGIALFAFSGGKR